MDFVLDIGNSDIKIGFFDAGSCIATYRVTTFQANGMPNIEALDVYMQAHPQSQTGTAIVSSVVPQFQAALRAWMAQYPQCWVFWITRENMSQIACGVDLSRYTHGQLGTDRVANLAGAVLRYPNQYRLIIDLGTTTTLDLLSDENVFLGGAICPGPGKFQSLLGANHAAQLFEVDVFSPPTESPGLSTQQSLANGLYYGYRGVLIETVAALTKNLKQEIAFILTGGYAKPAAAMLQFKYEPLNVIPELTLNGLYWIYERSKTR